MLKYGSNVNLFEAVRPGARAARQRKLNDRVLMKSHKQNEFSDESQQKRRRYWQKIRQRPQWALPREKG
jgi:hypothetical protein